MSRKRIVQLLASLAVLSCMILPVQAAPQVNIVPLVQLLLLNPAEPPEYLGSNLFGKDSDGDPILGNVFSTTDEQLCVKTEIQFSAASSVHVKIEWYDDNDLRAKNIDGNIIAEGPALAVINDCIIGYPPNARPPLPPPPLIPDASDFWKVIITLDGVIEDQFDFVIQ